MYVRRVGDLCTCVRRNKKRAYAVVPSVQSIAISFERVLYDLHNSTGVFSTGAFVEFWQRPTSPVVEAETSRRRSGMMCSLLYLGPWVALAPLCAADRTSSFLNFSNGGSASAARGNARAAMPPTSPLTNRTRDSGSPPCCICGLQ